MKVGVLIHDLHGGGAEAVARSWASRLADRGHDVVFLFYGPSSGQVRTDVPTAVFPGRSTAARWTALPWWVRHQAHRWDLDIVLSVLDFSNIAALLAALGSSRPVIISEHAVPTLLWRQGGAGGIAKHMAARLLYRRAAATLAVSHAVATDLRVSLSVPADRVVVLPNPVVDPTGAAHDGTVSGDVGTSHRLLVVGRCAPEKRMDRALQVLHELQRRRLGWTACVIGDGPVRAILEQTAQQEQLPVEFLGWVSPWQTQARSGDVLIVTSDLEGFGNVLVEAAAAGIPSVAPSPALGVIDAVLPDLTAVLSPTCRVDDLADAVLRAADLKVKVPAVQTWLERFHTDPAADRLEAVLQRAVQDSTDSPVVTHVGPDPDAQGGMAAVLRTYRDAAHGLRPRFLTSYVAGRPMWSVGPAARALLRLVFSRPAALGVVHVHLSYGGSFVREGGLAVVAALKRRPVVLTIHGSDFPEFLEKRPRLVRAVLRRATALVFLAQAHIALLPPDLRERAVLVPNTVTSDPGPPTDLPNTQRALFAGEVSTRKGVDVLLAAWPQVRSVLPDAELVMAGPEGDVAPTNHPGVTWVGTLHNEEVRSWLRRSRVAVLPSRREAMPMFVLEAMAAGRAVVSTPVGAIEDTVGEGGKVVPVGDVDALAEALSELLAPRGPAQRLGNAARSRFEAEYATEQGLNRLREVYATAQRSRVHHLRRA